MMDNATAASNSVIGVLNASGTTRRMLQAAQALRGAREAAALIVLAAEDLDHLVAVDRFFEHVHQVANGSLRLARHAPQALRHKLDEPRR